MKKWWLLCAFALLLAACGNDDAADTEDAVQNDMPAAEDTADEQQPQPADGTGAADEIENTAAEEPQPAEQNTSLSYKESAVLAQQIPLNELTERVQTDNPGKRIILFENNSGEKMYKSIFVKHNQFLKITDLKSDRLLYKGNVSS